MSLSEVKKVCVLGAGTMGSVISLLCAGRAGYDVSIYEVSEEAAEAARAQMPMRGGIMVALGTLTQEQLAAALPRITVTTDPAEAARDADLLSESVPERAEIKRQVHAQFDALLPPHAVMTTNTSTLPVSAIEDSVTRGEKFAALHFHGFGGSLVDVVGGPRTSKETVEFLTRFAKDLGETPMVLKKEKPGYLFNTMYGALMRSALSLVVRGYATPEDVDRAWMLVFKMPIGPFGIMDVNGLDITSSAGQQLAATEELLTPQEIADFFRPMLEKGLAGMKAGQGFYSYPNPAYQRPGFLSGDG